MSLSVGLLASGREEHAICLHTVVADVHSNDCFLPGVPKNGPLVYVDDNFGKYGPILTIFSLLQQ